MNTIITPHHIAAMKAAEDAMGKAFDGFLIIGLAQDADMKNEAIKTSWGGGRVLAVGLAHEFIEEHNANIVAAVLDREE